MNQRIIVFGGGQGSGWEHQDNGSYDVASLEREYRNRLYSSKGKEMVERAHNHTQPADDTGEQAQA